MRRDGLAALAVLLAPLAVAGPLHLAGVEMEGAVAWGVHGFWLAAALLVTRALGRPLADIGLRREELGRSLLYACLILPAILLAGLATTGVEWRALPGPARLAERALFTLGVSGPGQEILFRGLLLFSFVRWKGRAAGIAAASLLYGAAHVRMGPEGMAANAIYGLFYAAVALRTRNVWGPAIAHGLHNLVFGYVIRSGAAVL